MNPYLPTFEYIPDGEWHVFGQRVYLFGSHDRFGGGAYCMNDYVCWSAPTDDLTTWRCEGTIYRRSQDPTPIADFQRYMWAPDVTQGADGRYYLYYGIEFLNRIAVAVCDTPAGEYTYYGEVHYPDGTRYGGRTDEQLRFDPAVLNDDGRTYLYTGFGPAGTGCDVAELAEDMLTLCSEPHSVVPGLEAARGTDFAEHAYFEAPSVRRFDGLYYLSYSSVLSHELCYAVSRYPDRDFFFGGVLHSNANVTDGSSSTFYWGNNHGGLARIEGQYYVFAHRQTNRNECSRQGVAEPIGFADGHFRQAEMTSQGIGGPLAAKGTYEAGIACYLTSDHGAVKVTAMRAEDPYITQDGADRESDPGLYIANLRSGSICGYKYFDFAAERTLTLTVRPHDGLPAAGQIDLALDHELTFAQTQDVQIDGEERISFTVPACGTVPLYIRFRGTGALDLLTLAFR